MPRGMAVLVSNFSSSRKSSSFFKIRTTSFRPAKLVSYSADHSNQGVLLVKKIKENKVMYFRRAFGCFRSS